MNKSKGLLPAKPLTLMQSLVCLAVMFVIVITSFGTLFTVKFSQEGKAAETYYEIVDKLNGDEAVEAPDEIEVSAPFLIKSVGSVGTVFKALFKTASGAVKAVDNASQIANDMNNAQAQLEADISNGELDGVNQDMENLNNAQADAQDGVDKMQDGLDDMSEALKSDDFKGLIALIAVIFQSFGQSIILGLAYCMLIGMTITIPVTAIVCFVKALVSFILKLANPGEGYSKVVDSFGSVFIMFPTLWLLKILVPQITFGASVTTIVILIIVALAANLVASRLKGYTEAQFKYINILQGASLVGVIGYFIFMLNIDKTDMFNIVFANMKNASWSFVDKALVAVLALAMVSIMFTACKYIQYIACRLCCMTPVPKAKKNGTIPSIEDTYISLSAATLGLVIIPVILMVTKLKLDLGDNMGAFIVFSIGIVLMFAAELVFWFLKKAMSIDNAAVHAVLTGCPDKAEVAAEAAAAEEAKAAKAAEEEASEEAAEEAVEEEENKAE